MGSSSREFLETREAEASFTHTNEFIELQGMSRTLAFKDHIIDHLQKEVNQLKLKIEENEN